MKTLFPPHPTDDPVIDNPWASLRQYTDARIALGRSGVSVPTKHLLEFQLAHAKARDAVDKPLESTTLIESLKTQAWSPSPDVINLHSCASDRMQYLQRPDYGRRLNDASSQVLRDYRETHKKDYDLAIAIVDGLSSLAIESNIIPFLGNLIPELTTDSNPWQIAPLCIVEQGRVAIGDEIGELLHARCVVILIGERPGLSSPDSMGLYMTWDPKPGRTDAQRNCISNIRAAGLTYTEASRRTLYLLGEARVKQLSGVQLKDRTDSDVLKVGNNHNSFLTDSKTR